MQEERGGIMSGFETGMYRNLFAEIGKSQEEIERKLQRAAEILFQTHESTGLYYSNYNKSVTAI